MTAGAAVAVAVAMAMPVGTAVPPAVAAGMPAKNSIQDSHVQHSMLGFTDPPAAGAAAAR